MKPKYRYAKYIKWNLLGVLGWIILVCSGATLILSAFMMPNVPLWLPLSAIPQVVLGSFYAITHDPFEIKRKRVEVTVRDQLLSPLGDE